MIFFGVKDIEAYLLTQQIIFDEEEEEKRSIIFGKYIFEHFSRVIQRG